MSKKKHEEHEEHVNHEAWVIPYADMVTLLFALFLVLFATAQTDTVKVEQFATNLRTEIGVASVLNGGTGLLDNNFGGPGDPVSVIVDELVLLGGVDLDGDGSVDTDPFAVESGETRERLEDVDARLDEALQAAGIDPDAVQLQRDERGITVDISADGILFDSGAATLTDAGRRLVDVVIPLLSGVPNHIVVEGHTDNVPIATAAFPSNWELSSARAGAVLRYLLEASDIPPFQMSAAGYADTRPLAPNDTPEGRNTNRRVDIIIVSTETVGGAGVPNPAGQTVQPGNGTPALRPDLPAEAGLPAQ